MDLLTVIALVGTLSVLFILYLKRHYTHWASKGVPQLDPVLFLGDLKPVLLGRISHQEHFMNIYKKAKANGWKHVGIYTFLKPELITLDLKVVKSILVKDFDHFPGHGIFHHKSEPLTENLFNLEGEQWKKLRAKVSPTFTTGKMKMMFETLLEKADILTKVLSKYAETKEELNIKETLARFSTDVVASVAFGIECNSIEEPKNKFREIGQVMFKPNLKRAILEQMLPNSILGKLGYSPIPKEASSYFTEVVTETIRYRENNNVQRKDFMQLLLQIKKEGSVEGTFTDQEIVTEAFIFYLAGFETSSSATTFALLELSKRPDCQDKLRQEVHDILEKHDGKLTYDALMEMEYVDMVMREALRKYPPLPFLPRRCAKTYKVPDSDLVINKGTMVYIPAWGIQMDPEYYPNPEEFNPENFSAENKSKRPDYTWMPFGEGPRMCIGLRFGMMQSKVALISILKDHRVTLHEKTKWPCEMDTFSLVLSVKGDVWLKVEKL